ncbi:alanine--tRNA ligase, mitochondrial-like, partial [Diaphorina citri]|uniref:Alanine--tRNA ligase n=1 Tax=Diaphorina citri TaxID=121845 RepID=A0A3Q0JLL6_DIACI
MNNPNISSYVRLCSGNVLSMCQFKNVFLGLTPAPYPRVANSQKCIRVGGKHNDLSFAGRDSYHHTFFEMLGNWSFNDYYKRDVIFHVPYGDDSIAFVNSGMCQFKNVFLGLTPAPYPRVANSQKCVRVGGKHNDLSCAGRDSYHHTFFEMLGNWSFNDYYKRDACRMALEFLTKPPVSLPLDRLYFTYFGGSDQYGLPCDEETLDIWLELGVPRDHIKKEGMKCNFWEMGSTGPCGYSSEIHYDMKGEPSSALARVNADRNDLIEIWNIVFISHKRVMSADTIVPLSKNYIDTGLGFERLVTILQNKTSTYDTDLFLPLLETIEKVSGAKPYGLSTTKIKKLKFRGKKEVLEHAIRHARSGASIDSIQLEHNAWVGLIFDKTNLYATAGGQIDDIGVAYLTNTTQENGKVEIGELASLEGKIVHFGNVVSSFKVTPGLTSRVEVDARMRLGCMRAHTTSHLLNAALRRVLTCTYQKSCRVFSDECALDFSVYGETLSVDSVAAVEKYINDVIADQVQVDRRHMRASELPSLTHLTVIPGEIYPDDVILIDISDKENVISREPCCGTHVFNTGHIESCTVIGYKSYNHGVRSIKCLTGESSKAAVENGKQLSAAVKQLAATINQNSEQTDEETLNQQNHEIKTLRELLEDDLPYAVHKQNDHLLAELSKNVKLKLRQFAKVRITEELIEKCKEDTPYLVHYIRDDAVEIQALPPLSQISTSFQTSRVSPNISKSSTIYAIPTCPE